MSDIAALVADNLDIWTCAIAQKSGAGRGSSSKRITLYGIERLRALILDLGIRGKLVPQDLGDEPASELLKRIEKRRALLVPTRKRKQAEANADAKDATTIALPDGWENTTLSQLATIHRGVTYSKSEASDTEYPGLIGLLRGHNIQSEINLENLVYVPRSVVSDSQILVQGDIVIAMSSGSSDLVGKAAQYREGAEISFGAFCGVIRPTIEPLQSFLAFFCRTPFYRNQTQKGGKGIGIQNLSKGDLEGLLCPLPPLAEQRRIVAKVDELMALCDALERESADALVAHQTLVETLLATLVNSADAADLAANWARRESNFDTLFTTEASIDALKQTILDLAVRGKLVAQDAADEAASLLLRQVSLGRQKLVASGKAKRISRTKENMTPFALPESWQWSSLGEITQLITKGSSPKWQGVAYTDPERGLLFITSENVGNFGLRKLDEPKYVESRFSEIEPRSMLKKNDILINLVGASIGRTAVYDLNDEANINQAVALVRLVDPSLGPDIQYLLIFLNSATAIDIMLGSRVISAQPNISLADVSSFPIPIPPLAEQHRIVTKVDELMAVCDALKARITDAAQTRRHLADAIVERAAT